MVSVLRFLLAISAILASLPAAAGLFSDDEARDRIVRLEERIAVLEKINSRLEDAISKLEASNRQQTSSMLDMLTQVEQLNQELRGLRGQNEEMLHNLQDARSRQKDFYVDLDARVRKLETAEPVQVAGNAGAKASAANEPSALESSAFEVVNAYYRAANYAKVIDSANDFLQKFPKSDRVPAVYFLQGDAYFSKDDFKKSIASYQAIVSKFERDPMVPDAWLNIASCQQQLKDTASARKTLKLIIDKYPDSKAAAKAVKRLKTLK